MELTPVATGFGLLESPRADDRGLWFSDMAVGGIRCLRPDGRIDAYLTARKMIGGIAFNDDGRIICSGTGGLVWLDTATGATGTLLDAIDGEPIGGINDMVADGQGGLFFGTVDHPAMFRGEPFGASILYRLAPDGQVSVIRGGLRFANGCGLSPDGRRLYHNDSSVGTRRYDLAADGSVTDGGLFFDAPDCDGLAVDRDGGVWIALIQSGTIVRAMADGTVDRRLPVPGGHPTSLCFGGSDGRDLYVTTAAPGAGEAVMKQAIPPALTASLYHARADVAGVPTARTAFRL